MALSLALPLGNARAASLVASSADASAEDRARAESAIQRALETTRSRTTTFWTNAASGNAGAVMPVRTYRSGGGHYCRDYEERLMLRTGPRRTRTATACRDSAGVWRDIAAK